MPRNARQYTIRHVPAAVDEILRRRARSHGKSLNQVALEALTDGAAARREFDDLDFMIGSMGAAESKRISNEVARQRRIDPELWK